MLQPARALEVALQKFEQLKLSNCKSMTDYYNKATMIRSDITAADSTAAISNTVFVAKILRGLPPAYNSFVDHYHLLCEDPMFSRNASANILSQLLAQESKVKERNQNRNNNNTGKNSGNKDSKENQPRKKCTFEGCGKWGHEEEDCWVKNPDKKKNSSQATNADPAKKTHDPAKGQDSSKKPNRFAALATDDNKSSSSSIQGQQISLILPDPTDSSQQTQTTETEQRGAGKDDNGGDATYETNCFKDRLAQQENVFITNDTKFFSDSWVADTGASISIANNKKWFIDFTPVSDSASTAGIFANLDIVGRGTVKLTLKDPDGDPFELTVGDVHYAPSARCNLLSLSRLAKFGLSGSWNSTHLTLQTSDGYDVGKADLIENLWYLDLVNAQHQPLSKNLDLAATIDFDNEVWRWHRRLGHLSFHRMIKLLPMSENMGVTAKQIEAMAGALCPICQTTRAIVKIPREPARRRADGLGELLHIDAWGPYPVEGYKKTKYMCFVTDDATRYTWAIPIVKRNTIPDELRQLFRLIQNTHNVTIRTVRCDDEFGRGAFADYCATKGITQEVSAPYVQSQDGVAERGMRTMREGAAAMIRDTNLPITLRNIIQERGEEMLRNTSLPELLWPEAVRHAIWHKNRSPTRALKWKATPWEKVHNYKPDLSKERVWGSRVYVTMTEHERNVRKKESKLHHDRAWVGYFVGLENESTMRVWDPERKTVHAVVLAEVDDGHGLRDNNPGASITSRIQRTNREDHESESDPKGSSNESLSESDDHESHPQADAMMVKRKTSQIDDDDGWYDDDDDEESDHNKRKIQSRATSQSAPKRRPALTERQREMALASKRETYKYAREVVPYAKKPPHPQKRARRYAESDSEEERNITTVTENNTGFRSLNRTPFRERCNQCYHRRLNCVRREGETKCDNCILRQIRCKPLELDPDGKLPMPKFAGRPATDPNEYEMFLPYDKKCWPCKNKMSKCDATWPPDPSRPCTRCKEKGRHCISQERHRDEKELPKCIQCQNNRTRCNRKQPCDTCQARNKNKCAYKDDQGHVISYELHPDEKRKADGRCQMCIRHDNRHCDATIGGPPCKRCYELHKNTPARNNLWTCVLKHGENIHQSTDVTKYAPDSEFRDKLVFDPSLPDIRDKRGYRGNRGYRKAKKLESDSDDESDPPDTSPDTSDEESKSDRSSDIPHKPAIIHGSDDSENEHGTLGTRQAPTKPRGKEVILTLVESATKPDPTSYRQAISGPDAEEWKMAMEREYDSLIHNNTWTAVEADNSIRPIPTKWVYRTKRDPTGEIQKRKARLVARGDLQAGEPDDLYAGVVSPAAYRTLFALAALENWEIHQVDVSTAFLHGDVESEVYIRPPRGYEVRGQILKLNKALYGLREAPRQWHKKLTTWLIETGWTRSEYDGCVFYHEEWKIIMTIYVDDIHYFGPPGNRIQEAKHLLGEKFPITDEGRARYYLKMEIDQAHDGIKLHQNGYARQKLDQYKLTHTNTSSIPLDTGLRLETNEGIQDPKLKERYLSMVGSLNYLQTKTRPDLAFPVSLVSRYMSNPNQNHMDAVLQQYAYLAKDTGKGLVYKKNGTRQIEGFVDSDWAGCRDTARSTTGYIFTLAGAPISWKSERQKTVSNSSAEAEFIAASQACKEATWLLNFSNEVRSRMGMDPQESITLHIDNQSAIKMAHNPAFEGRTRHIKVRHAYIKECVEDKTIVTMSIPGIENCADILTKPAPRPHLEKHLARLSIE